MLVKRTQRNGEKLDISAPKVVQDYNKAMGGVDNSDMLRSFYEIDRKSKKWWYRLFFAMEEMALVNSSIVYKEMTGQNCRLLEYKRSVTQGLLTKGKVSKKRGRPKSDTPTISKKHRKGGLSVPDDVRLQNREVHWIDFVKERGRCELCATKKIESRPHSKCTTCKVFLCCVKNKNCFS